MKKILLGAALFLGAISGKADAATMIGFELDIFGNLNVPTFVLTNTSDPDVTISGLHFTIGDTSTNFDAIYNISGGTTDATLTS